MMRVQERSSRRGGGRSRRRIVFGWDVAAFSAVVLALLSVGLGSWWTTQAIMASDPLGTLLRFVLSASAGIYYIVMFDTAWRHGRLGQGRLMQGMRGRLGR